MLPLASLFIAVSVAAEPLAAQETATPSTNVGEPAPVPEGAPAGTDAIDRIELREHAFFFASDELEGRHTGTPGQARAAQYIAEHFESLGLTPLGDELEGGGRGFLQHYPVKKTFLVEENTVLRVGESEFRRGFGVLEGARSQDLDARGPLVFVEGAGRKLPENLPEGAVVFFVLSGRRATGNQGIEQQFMMQFSSMMQIVSRAQRAFSKGASAVLVGIDEGATGVSDLMNYVGLLPQKPLLVYGQDGGMATQVGPILKRDLPIVFLGPEVTASIRGMLPTPSDDDGEDEDGDEEGGEEGRETETPASEPAPVLAQVLIDIEVDDMATATNVCAILPGSDPELAKEAVVVSAHMDHIGVRLDGDVFNGADDNASGSSGLLEIAQAFTRGERPKRSVIFLSVSGEELGLWGSDYYATHPTWPLDRIVADINIDMIGRNAELSGPDEISITPSYAHPKYSSIGRTSAELAERFGLGLSIGDTYYERSDHYNFAERGVPVVFFCDGEHEDYHQVSDTADKLNYDKIERVARLAFWTGTTIANAAGRPSEIGLQKSWLEDER